jgi:hypothetical protein
MTSNVLDVLMERGFVEQVSDEAGLRAALEQPITCYIGYDPSASSLHVGSCSPSWRWRTCSAPAIAPSPSWAAAPHDRRSQRPH